MKRARVAFLFPLIGALACVVRYSAPGQGAHDARFGFLAGDSRKLDVHAACGHWGAAVGPLDDHATSHSSSLMTSTVFHSFLNIFLHFLIDNTDACIYNVIKQLFLLLQLY